MLIFPQQVSTFTFINAAFTFGDRSYTNIILPNYNTGHHYRHTTLGSAVLSFCILAFLSCQFTYSEET